MGARWPVSAAALQRGKRCACGGACGCASACEPCAAKASQPRAAPPTVCGCADTAREPAPRTAANREAGPAPPRDPLRDRPPRRQLHREVTSWLARKPCCGGSPNAADDRYGGHCCARSQRAESAALFRRAIQVQVQDDDTWSWEMAARMLGAVVGDPRVETRRPVPAALRELCRQRLIEIRRALAERPEGAQTYRWSFRPPRIDDRRITARDWAEVDYLFSEEDRWSHLALTGEDLGGRKPSKLPPIGGQYPGPGDLLLKLPPCGGIPVKTLIPKDWPHRWPGAAGSAQGKTWYVNASAKDAYSDGSYLHPFWDLRAFAQLDAYGKPLLQAGDRVIFAQGTYWVGPSANPALGKKADIDQNIAVWLPHGNEKQKSVTFEAAPCAHVVLHVLPKTPNYAGYGLVFASPEKWPGDALGVKPAQVDLVLTNLHFEGSVFATDSDQFAANRCENMVLFRATGVYLQGCTFRGGGDTLKDAATTNPVTNETTVDPGKNFVSGNLRGTVQIADADHGVVIDCVFDGRLRTVPLQPGGSEVNEHIVPDDYLKIWRSKDIVFERCVVMNGGHFGMYVHTSERITIRQCWFRNRLHTCLEFLQSKDCVVERCLFAGCGAATQWAKPQFAEANLIQFQGGGTGHRIRFNVLHGDPGAVTTGYTRDSALVFITDVAPHPFPSPKLLPELTDYTKRSIGYDAASWEIGGKLYATMGGQVPPWQQLAQKYVPRCLLRTVWNHWHQAWRTIVGVATDSYGSDFDVIPGLVDRVPVDKAQMKGPWKFTTNDPQLWPKEFQINLADLAPTACIKGPEGPFGCGQSMGPWPISQWCKGKTAGGVVCADGGAPDRCPDDMVRVFVRKDAIAQGQILSPFEYLKNYTVKLVDNGPGKDPTRVSTGYQAPPILPGSLVWPDVKVPDVGLYSGYSSMLYQDCEVHNNLILDIGERALHMGSKASDTPEDLRSMFWNNWIGNNIIYGQRSDPSRNFEKWFGSCGAQNTPLPVVAGVQVQDSDFGGRPLVDLSFPGFYDGSSGNRFVDNVIGRRPDDVLHVWVPQSIKAWLALQMQKVEAKAADPGFAGSFLSAGQLAQWKAQQVKKAQAEAAGFGVKKLWWDGAAAAMGMTTDATCLPVPHVCTGKPCLYFAAEFLRRNFELVFQSPLGGTYGAANALWLKEVLAASIGWTVESKDLALWTAAANVLAQYASNWGVRPAWASTLVPKVTPIYKKDPKTGQTLTDQAGNPILDTYVVELLPMVSPLAKLTTDWSLRLPRVVVAPQLNWSWSWAGQLNQTVATGSGNTCATDLDAIVSNSVGELLDTLAGPATSESPSDKNLGPWWPPPDQQPPASLKAAAYPSLGGSVQMFDFFGQMVSPDAAFRGPFDLKSGSASVEALAMLFSWANPGG